MEGPSPSSLLSSYSFPFQNEGQVYCIDQLSNESIYYVEKNYRGLKFRDGLIGRERASLRSWVRKEL